MTADSFQSDEQFVQRLTRCQRELRAFIVGLTPSQADADDVLQEVNLALWKKRDLYDPQQEFARWAFGFAVVEVRTFRSRSAHKRIWFSDEMLEALATDWSYDLSLSDQRREALSACLGKLDPAQREMITAFYGRRATAQELAEKHGKSLGSMYKVISRIRDSLRGCVKRSLSRSQHPPQTALI